MSATRRPADQGGRGAPDSVNILSLFEYNDQSQSRYLHSICIQGHLGPILFVCLKFTINLAHAHIMILKIKYEKTFTGKNSFPCDMNFDNELKLKMVTYLVLLLLEC